MKEDRSVKEAGRNSGSKAGGRNQEIEQEVAEKDKGRIGADFWRGGEREKVLAEDTILFDTKYLIFWNVYGTRRVKKLKALVWNNLTVKG